LGKSGKLFRESLLGDKVKLSGESLLGDKVELLGDFLFVLYLWRYGTGQLSPIREELPPLVNTFTKLFHI